MTYRAQNVLAVLVVLTVLLACISPFANLPFAVSQVQQGVMLAISMIVFAAQRILLRRSSDPVLQGVFDATPSLVPLSGSSTLACALLC